MTDFQALGLHANLLKALERQGLTIPTPIQIQAIPHVMEGRDLMGLAQTGTGKTAAFGLPLLHRLMQIGKAPQPRTVRALILAPTRELVNQIADNIGKFGHGSHIRTTVVVGGASINKQMERLARGTDVLVATPGRLLDLLERQALTLAETRYLVLDEADQMLDLGFIHALRRIARLLPEKRQTLLFSATMPKQMEELATTYLREPVRVQVSPPGKAADKITQGVHFTPQGDKATVLRGYLSEHADELALVFSRTKHGAEKLMKLLDHWGFAAGSIHGNKSQGQRERTLQAFRNGDIKVLVATDVAARGIDIPGVRHVYNFDLPNVPENYVHRIGRTARAGAEGRAVAFCSPAEVGELRAIEKLMKIALPVVGGEHMAQMRHEPAQKPKAPQGRRQGVGPSGAGAGQKFGGRNQSRPQRRRSAA
ncbi:DEAD/DEAH box helicase [Plastorhodobacter daqingensis]|uniref:DEAD/DEAH box helicase n=1 Tax=Plastorhodobacter daqingensis TaxID=1387281 RepID=A0ABW2UGN4_9RHOB